MGIQSASPARLALVALAAVITGLAALAAGTRTAPEAAHAAPPAPLERPNVVVIETDDQTDHALRFLDNVNRLLVRQGVRFTNSFASFPLCCPSRATFLTGQYAHNHDVRSNNPPRGGYGKLDETNTLPVWLQDAGYHTALVGRYFSGYGLHGTERNVPPGWSEWYGAATLPYVGFTLNQNGVPKLYTANQANYQTDVLTRIASDVIRRTAQTSQPLFLWVTYFAPHAGNPVDSDDPQGYPATLRGPSPAARYRDAFANVPLPRPKSFNEANVADKPPAVRRRPRFTGGLRDAITEMYRQELESLQSVDQGVAAIVDALRRSGQLADTLIVFTSDNGFMHGEHRIPYGKNVVYEPSVRVPLVMRGPGIPRARRIADTVANIDLAPTIVEATGTESGLPMDGRSLLPLATDPLADYGRDILLETTTYSAIRTDRYKYVEYRNGPRELYDLEADPNELASRRSGPPVIRAELRRRLTGLRRCDGALCREGPRLVLRATCTQGDVRARVAGDDAWWVSTARFYVDERPVARADRAPFSKLLPRHLVESSAAKTIRARVATKDGRGVTLMTRVSCA